MLMLGLGVPITSHVALSATDTLQKAIGTAVPGVMLTLVGCFAPLALFKLLAFVDPGTAAGASFRSTMDANGGVAGLGKGKGAGAQAAGLKEAELKLARPLIPEMSAPWDADDLRASFKDEIPRLVKQKAEADIAQERKKAVNEVKDEIGGMAMEIASKVVEREIKEADHKDLIDEFIKNVGEAS